jgi:hypothetical protein
MERCGVLSLRGPSRRPIDYNQTGLTALVESSLLPRWIAILDAVFVKDMFHQGIRRPIIPSWIVIEVQSDRRNRASADIGASPAAVRNSIPILKSECFIYAL